MENNKVSEFFNKFFQTRNVAFYAAFVFAVLAFVGGIVATAGASVADCGPLPIVFTLLGLVAFVGLSLIGREWAGAGAVAVASFMSVIAAICGVYPYYLAEVQDLAMTGINVAAVLALPGLGALIAAIVILFICAVAALVLSWLRLRDFTQDELEAKYAKKAAARAKSLGDRAKFMHKCDKCGCPMESSDAICPICGKTIEYGTVASEIADDIDTLDTVDDIVTNNTEANDHE